MPLQHTISQHNPRWWEALNRYGITHVRHFWDEDDRHWRTLDAAGPSTTDGSDAAAPAPLGAPAGAPLVPGASTDDDALPAAAPAESSSHSSRLPVAGTTCHPHLDADFLKSFTNRAAWKFTVGVPPTTLAIFTDYWRAGL